ncbi:RdgB/HAM1 family non-canonical purine NTP pyrophosphatase [Emcibacter nanhaiensis]|uniref:dITP/XTP pyrophosphatase n=1 Tax=Emcibacter nanhaiensis TaxID=1505037 RepID=A0A501PJC0_9PROT|nr:RdgB/HAM1 family non-canonical purine NTP pyrophosphatase [Emcibacter nanhaiensis]TPD59796.1 RdgB/HAM1 family non-canonical purine NTP pyrophosphatase [Emcibacter nanhaiensis]
MARKFREHKLVVASHNPGKVREISELLHPFGVEVYSAEELNLTEPEETGATFLENAELKARSAASESGLVALADDSGLVVPPLGGIPGIYSARYAVRPDTGERDFDYGMEKLTRELEDKHIEKRSAHFSCALSLAWPPSEEEPEGHAESFEGRVYGTLVWPPRGENGFGYDPIFEADGYHQTFGEMDPEEKHDISHRADAFRKLIKACFEQNS